MIKQSTNPDNTSSNENPKKLLGRGIAIGVGAGILLSAIGFWWLSPSHNIAHNSTRTAGEQSKGGNQPLYWVAPMDPNFKRDKPGKSPMGMDLVPVYEETSANDSPGTVTIDPVTIQNLGVKTAVIERTSPSITINAVGHVEYAQDSIEHVHSRIEGWIETISVRTRGDFIRQGEPLYSIYSPELVNAQEELLIALNQKTPALINAARARLRALAVPNAQIESLERTRKVSQTITFLAPVTGYVEALNIQKGFYVTPSITMLSIASLDKVWVVADVFPSDASLLSLGLPATITSDDLPGKQIKAELSYLYPTLNSTSRTVQARFVVNHIEGNTESSDTSKSDQISQWLKPGMYTKVQMVPDANSQAPIILAPKQAIIRTGTSDRVVLALSEGKYKSIEVELGQSFDDMFEILDGLAQGDEIVTSAQFLIDSESSITSDFMRMAPDDNPVPMSGMKMNSSEEGGELSAWTEATVNEVNAERRRVNLTHGYLEAFNMMGMTMDFTVADDIDMAAFVIGQSVHVEIIREDTGMFQVKTLHVMDKEESHRAPEHSKGEHEPGDHE